MHNGPENNNIRRIRTELSLTQDEISGKMGVSRSTFCSLESGKTSIFSSAARKFLKATGCHEAELVLGVKLPRNENGTLMQEPDYEQMIKATVDDYEKKLAEKNTNLEILRNSLNEKIQLLKSKETIIRNQEREISRLEKSLSRYEPD